jgi:hypothetical protein
VIKLLMPALNPGIHKKAAGPVFFLTEIFSIQISFSADICRITFSRLPASHLSFLPLSLFSILHLLLHALTLISHSSLPISSLSSLPLLSLSPSLSSIPLFPPTFANYPCSILGSISYVPVSLFTLPLSSTPLLSSSTHSHLSLISLSPSLSSIPLPPSFANYPCSLLGSISDFPVSLFYPQSHLNHFSSFDPPVIFPSSSALPHIHFFPNGPLASSLSFPEFLYIIVFSMSLSLHSIYPSFTVHTVYLLHLYPLSHVSHLSSPLLLFPSFFSDRCMGDAPPWVQPPGRCMPWCTRVHTQTVRNIHEKAKRVYRMISVYMYLRNETIIPNLCNIYAKFACLIHVIIFHYT